jgi:DNA-binding CsgD family transcriptional regulator
LIVIRATTDPTIPPVGNLAGLPEAHRRLMACTTVGEVLAVGASEACRVCGFARGVILEISDGQLRAERSDPLPDPASDRLRRLVAQRPLPLLSSSLEAGLIRQSEGLGVPDEGLPSTVAPRLELECFAVEVITLDGRATALLVLDRPEPAPDGLDGVLARIMAAIVGGAISHVLLRSRVADVASELRHLTAFSHALMTEVLDAPIGLPATGTHGHSFPVIDAVERPAARDWQHLLSAQELNVARLLVQGRSNREIASDLVVSIETVKTHVARIFRKLEVMNRAQAVALLTGRAT